MLTLSGWGLVKKLVIGRFQPLEKREEAGMLEGESYCKRACAAANAPGGYLDKINSPRPQRGQGRSDLFSKENLRFPLFCRAATPSRLAQNPVRRALKFSRFVGVQLHGSIFVRKCAGNCCKKLFCPEKHDLLLARPV